MARIRGAVGMLPKEIRDALIRAAQSGGTPEHRCNLIDAIMDRARRNYPQFFKAD